METNPSEINTSYKAMECFINFLSTSHVYIFDVNIIHQEQTLIARPRLELKHSQMPHSGQGCVGGK